MESIFQKTSSELIEYIEIDTLEFIRNFFSKNRKKTSCSICTIVHNERTSIIVQIPYYLKSKKCIILSPEDYTVEQVFNNFNKYPKNISSKITCVESDNLQGDKIQLSEQDLIIINAKKLMNDNNKNNFVEWFENNITKLNVDLLIIDQAQQFPLSFWNNITFIMSLLSNEKIKLKILFFPTLLFTSDNHLIQPDLILNINNSKLEKQT